MKVVYEACLVGGSKAVVDIDDRYAAGAGIEHGEQRGETAKARAIAHARGDGDDRTAHEAADNACQGALHAGDGDNDLGSCKFLGMREQAVQARDAHVVEAVDVVAVELGGEGGFFGDGQVTRGKRGGGNNRGGGRGKDNYRKDRGGDRDRNKNKNYGGNKSRSNNKNTNRSNDKKRGFVIRTNSND